MLGIETIHWHTLAPQFLGPDSNVLDLGANYGQFSEAIIKRTGCHCVAVEPSPPFFSVIPDQISKQMCAIGVKSGTAKFIVDEKNPVASRFGDGEGAIDVQVKTIPEIMREFGWERIDLLKADIEGMEIDLLNSLSDDFLKTKVAQITVEFHDFCGFTSRQEVIDTIRRLNSLGFLSLKMSARGHQDTLHLNSNLLLVSASDMRYHQLVTRNVVLSTRVAKRAINMVFGSKLKVA